MDVQAIDTTQAAGKAAATGQLPAFPATDPAQHPPGRVADETLHHALSQLVGGGSNVSVQFRFVGQHEVVTVFKNAETGEVITQFPSEAMVMIAQFFNQLAGAVVDRTA